MTARAEGTDSAGMAQARPHAAAGRSEHRSTPSRIVFARCEGSPCPLRSVSSSALRRSVGLGTFSDDSHLIYDLRTGPKALLSLVNREHPLPAAPYQRPLSFLLERCGKRPACEAAMNPLSL